MPEVLSFLESVFAGVVVCVIWYYLQKRLEK